MGVVYKATDPVLNRTVAIKIMSEGMAHDEALRARFLREAQAAGSLQHPNVVTIYDFGETDGHLFIAMEYVQGADLEHLLKHNAPLTLAARLDIIIDVLNGLSYAHRRGIVHRDIKPANIRVDEEGHARIMDFGVAHLGTSNLTGTGVMMGTPNYMAPELISGEATTPAVDLFSAGAMLFELLTHQRPFQGDTLHSVLFKIVSDTPPDVCELKPDLPPALSAIVAKSLAKDPMERYRTAAEMANALSAIRVPLGPSRLSKTVSQRISIDKGLQAQREAQRHTVKVRRWRMIGGSAAAVVGAVAVVLFALRGKSPSASSPSSTVGAPSPASPTAPALTTAGIQPDPVPGQRGAVVDSTQLKTQTPSPVASLPQPKSAPPQSPAPAQRPDRETSRRSTLAASQPERATVTKSAVVDSSRVVASVPAPGATAQGNPTPPNTSAVSAPPPAATPPVTAPTVAAPTTKPAAEPENPTPAINAVISSYGRAIGSRDVSEVRRVYAGMTAQQQSQLESFFASVRSLTATLQVGSLDVNGNTAIARVTGVYEYVTRAGRNERQPVSFEATLQREAERWKLQAIR